MILEGQNRLKRNFLKTTISSRLKCPICLEVFFKPRRLYCGHTFCKPCLKQLFKPHKNPEHKHSCPLCRAIIDIKNIGYDLLASKIIDELQVTCNVTGCPWKGESSLLDTHYNYECKMKDYLAQKDSKKKHIISEPEHFYKDDDEIVQRINQNVQRGSLISRVVSKNPHLLATERRQEGCGIPGRKALVSTGVQTHRKKVIEKGRDIDKIRNIKHTHRQPQKKILPECNFDQQIAIYGPKKQIKKPQIKKEIPTMTLEDELRDIEALQRQMNIYPDEGSQNLIIKKPRPLIINLDEQHKK